MWEEPKPLLVSPPQLRRESEMALSSTTQTSIGEPPRDAKEMDLKDEEDARILHFLDSMDAYVALQHLLSSSLRQGWLELASARHSMGTSRISSILYDLKEHEASSTVQVNEVKASSDENSTTRPQFTFVKWGSYENGHHSSGDIEVKGQLDQTDGPKLRRQEKDSSGVHEEGPALGSLTVDSQVQKRRSKSLSMFGALVSPKLRSAQLSFEKALELLVQIANMQSAMQSTFHLIQKRRVHADGTAACEEE